VPLHKLLKGAEASKWLPFAKRKLKQLVRRKSGAVLSSHVKGLPNGADVLVKTSPSQDFIRIIAGDYQFIFTQILEKDGLYISKAAYWLYNPVNHYLKQIHEEEYTGTIEDENRNTIGSWDWDNGDDVTGSALGMSQGRLRRDFIQIFGFNPRQGATYDYPYGTLWETKFPEVINDATPNRKYMPVAFTNTVNMKAPYNITHGTTDYYLEVSGASLYSVIRKEQDGYDVLGDPVYKFYEYALAIRQQPGGDKEEYIVNREVGVDTDWSMHTYLGKHGSSLFGVHLGKDNFGLVDYAISGTFATPHVHIKSSYITYNAGPNTHTYIERVWESDYDSIVEKFEWTWETYTTPLRKELDNFLDDVDGDLVGGVYSYYAQSNLSAVLLAPYTAQLDFFSGLKEDGIDNAAVLFSLDETIFESPATPDDNYKLNCNRFWVVSKSITTNPDGTREDNSVYGVCLVGSDLYDSVIGRWDRENGFEIIFQTDAYFLVNLAINGRYVVDTAAGRIVDMISKKWKKISTAKKHPEAPDNPYGMVYSVYPINNERA